MSATNRALPDAVTFMLFYKKRILPRSEKRVKRYFHNKVPNAWEPLEVDFCFHNFLHPVWIFCWYFGILSTIWRYWHYLDAHFDRDAGKIAAREKINQILSILYRESAHPRSKRLLRDQSNEIASTSHIHETGPKKNMYIWRHRQGLKLTWSRALFKYIQQFMCMWNRRIIRKVAKERKIKKGNFLSGPTFLNILDYGCPLWALFLTQPTVFLFSLPDWLLHFSSRYPHLRQHLWDDDEIEDSNLIVFEWSSYGSSGLVIVSMNLGSQKYSVSYKNEEEKPLLSNRKV